MKVSESKFEYLAEREGAEQTDFSTEHLESFSSFDCRIYFQKQREKEQEGSATINWGPVDLYSAIDQSEEVRKRLVDLFEDFVNTLRTAGRTGERLNNLARPVGRSREKELKWMRDNKSTLERLAGKWIALEGEQLIASSEDFSEVVQKTEAQNISIPFVIFVPEITQDFAGV